MNQNFKPFYQLWTQQLLSEFEKICWHYSTQMSPPLFEISESTNQYGSWNPNTKTISISSHLIRNHSWAVTINVLKHEMAHQLCTEVLKSRDTAHGPSFQTACDTLGVETEFRSASGDLPLHFVSEQNIQSEAAGRFINKIEKLLALAKSSNEHEAALAMQKANNLIEKYNLRHIKEQRETRYAYHIINRKKKIIEGWQRKICHILRDFFFVNTILSYLYDPNSDQTHKTIEIIGSEENVTVAEYCYSFLEKQLNFLWQQNKQKYKGSTRTEKNSYYLGLLHGFYTKLENQNAKNGTQKNSATSPNNVVLTSSLVLAEDLNLQRFVNQRFPRLQKKSHRGAKIYSSTFAEGVETGKKIILHQGVSHKTGYQGKKIC